MQGVTFGMTVLKFWGSLVAGVEGTLLKGMRARDPANRQKWRLFSGIRKEGPAAEINKVRLFLSYPAPRATLALPCSDRGEERRGLLISYGSGLLRTCRTSTA